MDARQAMKNTPGWVLAVCFTILGVVLISAFVVLAVTGSDAEQFSRFLNTVMNAATVLLSGGAFALAGSAAKSSHNADKQTNGQLTALKDEIAALKQGNDLRIGDHVVENIGE